MLHAYCRRLLMRTLTALLIVVVAGCGSAGLKTYPVEGRIIYTDGSPVKGGTVNFVAESDNAADGKSMSNYARGAIEADGSFQLITNRELKGAVAGVHRVAIDEPPVAGSDYDVMQAERKKPAVLPKYASYDTSGLEVTIEPRSNAITITIKRP